MAIVFSPPFAPAPNQQPTYPNYTLPIANLTLPTAPSSPNLTLILSPTSSSLASGPQTGCRLASTKSSGNQISQSAWLRDQDGWRSQWLIGGLTPTTNYTAFVIQDSTKVSGPIYLVTKCGKSTSLLHLARFLIRVSSGIFVSPSSFLALLPLNILRSTSSSTTQCQP